MNWACAELVEGVSETEADAEATADTDDGSLFATGSLSAPTFAFARRFVAIDLSKFAELEIASSGAVTFSEQVWTVINKTKTDK
jgi:hypothetical protein